MSTFLVAAAFMALGIVLMAIGININLIILAATGLCMVIAGLITEIIWIIIRTFPLIK